MGLIKYLGGLMMVGMFTLALITFFVNSGIENEAGVQLNDDPSFGNFNTSLRGNISKVNTDASSGADSYFTSTNEEGSESSVSGEQFKVGIGTMYSMGTGALTLAYQKVFGEDSSFGIFLTALLSFLLVIGGLYGYKAWFGRNPD